MGNVANHSSPDTATHVPHVGWKNSEKVLGFSLGFYAFNVENDATDTNTIII